MWGNLGGPTAPVVSCRCSLTNTKTHCQLGSRQEVFHKRHGDMEKTVTTRVGRPARRAGPRDQRQTRNEYTGRISGGAFVSRLPLITPAAFGGVQPPLAVSSRPHVFMWMALRVSAAPCEKDDLRTEQRRRTRRHEAGKNYGTPGRRDFVTGHPFSPATCSTPRRGCGSSRESPRCR